MKPTKAQPELKKAKNQSEWKVETSGADKNSDSKMMKGKKAC